MTPDVETAFISACSRIQDYEDHIDGLVEIIKAADPDLGELDTILVMLWHKIEERVIGKMRN